MECSTDLVVLSDHGNCRIAKCICCSRFQLTFNNILINMNYNELKNLKNIICSYDLQWPYSKGSIKKDILLRSYEGSSVYFGFTLSEWFILKQIFEEAIIMNSFYENIQINLN
jgi:hypothetical protein